MGGIWIFKENHLNNLRNMSQCQYVGIFFNRTFFRSGIFSSGHFKSGIFSSGILDWEFFRVTKIHTCYSHLHLMIQGTLPKNNISIKIIKLRSFFFFYNWTEFFYFNTRKLIKSINSTIIPKKTQKNYV